MKNAETFTEVYKRHAASIIKSVVARTNDRELADEICQNVFLAYYKHMDHVQTEFIKAWLYEMMEHQLIDYWRKASTNHEKLIDEDAEGVLDPEDRMNIEKQYSDRRFIYEIMEKLKERNRNWYDVIECICIRQMTQEEACRYMGISSADLRSRLYRARKFLKEEFEKER